MWQSFDVFFGRTRIFSAVSYFRAPLLAIFIFTPSGESYCLGAPLENPFKTNWREGLSCSPIRFFSAPHLTPVRGRWLYSRKMIRDVSIHLFHLRTKEEMRPALHHRQNVLSLMILMFLFVQGLVDLLTNLVDLISNHKIRLLRQITLDFHQDCLQLLHLLVEKENKSGGSIA